MTLIIVTIGWLLGLVAADLYAMPIWPLAAIGLGMLTTAALSSRRPRLRLVALLLACAALGAARYDLSRVPTTEHSVWLLNDQATVTIEGTIVEDPRRVADAQRVLIATERAIVDGRPGAVTGMVLAKLP